MASVRKGSTDGYGRARAFGPRGARLAALAIALLLCALPARALASTTEVSMMMDDDQLIYVDNGHMDQTLWQMKALGVDVVKVSLVWQLAAPDPYSSQRPSFNAADPAAYPYGAWQRWDNLVLMAHYLGMKVYFLVIGPAPDWAVPKNTTRGQGPSLGLAPNPRDYQQFVQAAGTRYSGSYVPAGASAPLPRVGYWGIWNEPNERSWLNPWYRPLSHHRRALLQPELYRGLVDAAWNGLSASGHAHDSIMIGETANVGTLQPRQFVEDLYCVGADLRPLRGAAAQSYDCPASGSAGGFAAAHPGLFKSAGYSYHPYAFAAPDRPYPDRSFITLENLESLERMLVRIFATYGLRPSGGVPLYLTEWGYKTNPPNPYATTTPAEQATWTNEGEYMTWRDPYVRAFAQFLLVDSAPKQSARRGSALYWSTFQTGLETQDGGPKPALDAFRVPIWLPVARHGRRVAVWGEFRPANHAATQSGEIDFEPSGSSAWSKLASVETGSPEGYFLTRVAIPRAGFVRVVFTAPNGSTYYSRSAAVR